MHRTGRFLELSRDNPRKMLVPTYGIEMACVSSSFDSWLLSDGLCRWQTHMMFSSKYA